jgi:nucleoside 2-deoxyribosyltransferase
MIKPKIFVATSYSSKVDYKTGRVLPEFREFLEQQFETIERAGAEVFSAILHDNYQINDADPAGAFRVDWQEIKKCDVFLALLDAKVSAGVQAEIGMAVAFKKPVLLARPDDIKSEYFNVALIKAGLAQEISLPLKIDEISEFINTLKS